MNNQPKIPEPETVQRHVERLREICQGFDAANLVFDEVIARLEADNRRSHLYNSRLENAKKLLDSRQQEKPEIIVSSAE